MNTDLTADRLRELLTYDPETGVFHRRADGRIAGTLDTTGYWKTSIDRVRYLNHRLAWLYVHGRWPTGQIDHANGDTSDNRLVNLREATRFENAQNIGGPRSHNKTGFLGVFFSTRHGRYCASIRHNKKYSVLGYFDQPEAAHEAYLKAKRELHTFSARIA